MAGYKAFFRTRSDLEFATNALVFAAEEEALKYGAELFSRWLAVDEYEIRKTDEMVTYRFDGQLGKAVAI